MEQPSVNVEEQISSAASDCKPWECFKSVVWWRNAATMSIAFAPKCALPAGLWLVILALFVFPLYYVIKTMNGTVDVSQLVQSTVIYVACMLIALPLSFWFVGAWLVRLTAFCAGFAAVSEREMMSTKLNAQDIRAHLNTSMKVAAEKKVFLAKFWSSMTALLIVPCIFLVIPMLVLTVASPGIFGTACLQLPLWAALLTHLIFWSAFSFITIVSFVGICISANASVNPIQHAKLSMQISMQKFFPLLVLSTLSVFIATLLTSPIELFRGLQTQDVFALNVSGWSVVEEIWRAISSTVVLTLSTAPICEYLRGSLNRVET